MSNGMTSFVQRALARANGHGLVEEIIRMEGDDYNTIRVGVNPTTREINSLKDEGFGLRILVGADELRDQLLVWAGSGEDGGLKGAMHDTIGDQYGMSLHYNRHVPLAMRSTGEFYLTTTVSETELFTRGDVIDVLDRNKWFRKRFGDVPINTKRLRR